MSLKHGNLMANPEDNCMISFPSPLFLTLMIVGHDDARRIAQNELESEEDEETDSAEEKEDMEREINTQVSLRLAQLVRFFTHGTGDLFSVFVECGVNRDINASLVNDNKEIAIRIQMQAPPDALIQSVNNYKASSIILGPSDEIISIKAPSNRKFCVKKPSQAIFPSPEMPLWVIFTFTLESEEIIVAEPSSIHIDLVSLLSRKEKEVQKI